MMKTIGIQIRVEADLNLGGRD